MSLHSSYVLFYAIANGLPIVFKKKKWLYGLTVSQDFVCCVYVSYAVELSKAVLSYTFYVFFFCLSSPLFALKARMHEVKVSLPILEALNERNTR